MKPPPRLPAAGTGLGSPYDFFSAYLKHVATFIGLTPVVAASIVTGSGAAESLAQAHAAIDALAL